MSLFEKNFARLQAKNPELARRIQSDEEDAQVSFKKSKTGIPVAIVHKDGQKFALHHPENPIQHAQRFVQEIENLETAHNLLVLGCGLGYVPLLIQNAHSKLRNFIILEPSISVFRHALHMIDLQEILDLPNTTFLAGEEPRTVYNKLIENLMEYVANPILLVDNFPITAAFPKWASAVRQQIQEALRLGQSGLITKFKDGPLTLKNLFHNMDWIVNSPGISQANDLLYNLPAVVVAAGPSLMKNIGVLHNYQQNLLIIATDTAYNILLNYNIIPQFVITIDPTELNLSHLPARHYGPDSFLLFDPEARPEIVQKFSHRMTYMTDKHPFFNWLDNKLGGKGIIPKGGMVSQSALQVALYFGCSPVILVGQDLAFDPETCQTHAPSAALCRDVRFLEDDENHVDITIPDLNTSNREKLFWVDGIDGEKVPTVQSFMIYLRMLEEDIRKTQTPIIDATEGGAKIAGTIIQPLEEALSKLQKDSIRLSEIMTEMLVRFRELPVPGAAVIKREFQEILHRRLILAREGFRDYERHHNESPDQLERRLENYRKRIFSDPTAEYLIEYGAPKELFEFLKLGPANASQAQKRQIILNRWKSMLNAVTVAEEVLKGSF